MKKILIITYYWTPSGGAGVQRWIRFVKYLREFGWEPVIYCPDEPHYTLVDERIGEGLPENLTVYKHKIKEANSLIAKAQFWKKKEDKGLHQIQQQKGGQRSVFQKFVWFVRGNFFIPDARFSWVKPSVKYLDGILEKEKFDAIVTTGPPHSMHLIGKKLKEKHDFLWLTDFRDPWTSMDYLDEMYLTSFARKKHARLEESIVTKSDQMIVVGRTMYNEYLEKYGVKSEVIYNGYEDNAKNEKVFELDDKFTIVHIGSFLKNRNCDDLWKVLSEYCKESQEFAAKLEIRLIGNVAPNVLEAIESFGLNDNLNLIPYIPFEETQKFLFGAQTLLLPIDRIKNAEFVLTGKMFEYLKSKRPILLLAPIKGDATDIIQQCQAGYCCDFNDEIAIRESLEKMFELFKENKNVINSINVDQFSAHELTRQLTKVLDNKLS